MRVHSLVCTLMPNAILYACDTLLFEERRKRGKRERGKEPSRKESQIYFKGTKIRPIANLSTETMLVRRQWNDSKSQKETAH